MNLAAQSASALRHELAAHEINPVTGEPSHCACDVCDAARAMLRDHAELDQIRRLYASTPLRNHTLAMRPGGRVWVRHESLLRVLAGS